MPEAKNPTLEKTFPSDPFAAATNLPKVIGNIYVTTYAMSLFELSQTFLFKMFSDNVICL